MEQEFILDIIVFNGLGSSSNIKKWNNDLDLVQWWIGIFLASNFSFSYLFSILSCLCVYGSGLDKNFPIERRLLSKCHDLLAKSFYLRLNKSERVNGWIRPVSNLSLNHILKKWNNDLDLFNFSWSIQLSRGQRFKHNVISFWPSSLALTQVPTRWRVMLSVVKLMTSLCSPNKRTFLTGSNSYKINFDSNRTFLFLWLAWILLIALIRVTPPITPLHLFTYWRSI